MDAFHRDQGARLFHPTVNRRRPRGPHARESSQASVRGGLRQWRLQHRDSRAVRISIQQLAHWHDGLAANGNVCTLNETLETGFPTNLLNALIVALANYTASLSQFVFYMTRTSINFRLI